MSPTVAVSPGASPTGTQQAGTNQGPADSATPANTTANSSNAGSNPLADALPLILVGLGVIALLALLFIPLRILLRRRLVPLPSPKVPPSGAAPWSRAPVSTQAQPGQPPFFNAQASNGPFYPPGSAPFPGGFNGAPTLANAPGATWNTIAPPAGPRPPSMQPVGPALPGYGNQAQNPWPFPAPPTMPFPNGYIGVTPNQQPFPTTPPLLPGVQVGYTGNQPGPSASPAPPDDSSEDANQPGDSLNNSARKRLKRNGLYTSGEHRAFGEQINGNASADMMVVSDSSPRIMLTQHNQKGQVVKQAPEEFNAL